MNIYKATRANIGFAADIIREGGIVSFPTETVYGLGADIFNPEAVVKIFAAKERPFFDPLIAHIAEPEGLHDLTEFHPAMVSRLAEKFWPGPLTMVLPKKNNVPDIATSGLPTVAVRMPDHPVARELIRLSGTAIAAPSANPFGYLSPTSAEHVERYLGDRVPMIIDGGTCTVGVESTIIKVEEGRTILLRPGGIAIEDIETITGPLVYETNEKNNPEAPGQLPWHYSPEKKLQIVPDINDLHTIENDAAFLLYKNKSPAILRNIPKALIAFLSESGDLTEAAANIFAKLHYLDRLPVKIIYAEAVPEEGLGRAIMDRLLKASKKYQSGE